MEDDDGTLELNLFDLTLEGLDSALSDHFDRQDELSWVSYEELIKTLEL